MYACDTIIIILYLYLYLLFVFNMHLFVSQVVLEGFGLNLVLLYISFDCIHNSNLCKFKIKQYTLYLYLIYLKAKLFSHLSFRCSREYSIIIN